MNDDLKVKSMVTIKDVARLSGVAPSTVSKVINATGNITLETKRRVENAIEKLNYRPNSIARSLRRNKTLTIGMINNSHNSKNNFVLQMMIGVEETAKAEGLSVFLCNSAASQAREQEYIRVLIDKQVDGIIFLDNVVKRRPVPHIESDSMPVVFLNEYVDEGYFASVIPDDRQGGYLATQHLLTLGHQRIAHISGRQKHEASHGRLQGYKDALQDAKIAIDTNLIVGGDTWDETGGYQAVHELMAMDQPPTAIFCANDALAIGALDALRELRREVPRDVALVGFDDSLSASQKRPPLTSVALPFLDMGKLATTLLVTTARKHHSEEKLYRVPCNLVTRESCGAVLRPKYNNTTKGGG